MLGEEKKTERGFDLIEFTDINGRECTLQQSSAIDGTERGMYQPGSSSVWLGIDDERMHLDRAKVKELIWDLANWLDTGTLCSSVKSPMLDDRTMDECIDSLASSANFMRGMCLDPAIPGYAKEAMADRIELIDKFTERLTTVDFSTGEEDS